MVQAMIRIGDGSEMRFEMNGHAGMGEPGNDLVCAAASILAQTLIQSLCLDRDIRDGKDRLQCNWQMSAGHAEADIRARGKRRTAARAKMEMLSDGMKLLEDAFPEAIHVQRK